MPSFHTRRLVPIALLSLLASACGDESVSAGPGAVASDSGATSDGLIADGGVPSGDSGATTGSDVATGADTGPLDTATGADTAPVDATGPQGCRADQCTIDGACRDNGTAASADPCKICLVVISATGWSESLGAPCDDGDKCTDKDTCDGGKCSGVKRICEDGNLCTDDSCDAESGDCVHAPNAVTCTADNLCTAGDACKAGTCGAGAEIDCQDTNPCTDDACDPKKGCVHTANSAACDDGDKCTDKDACKAKSCAGGAPVSCDDGDVCTIDGCHPTEGCKHKSIADMCKDDNPCTDDSCDKAKGCLYAFNSVACDDGSKCTTADTCTKGACLGAPVAIDDANPCTDDACDPKIGPTHAANTLPCDDGSKCTLGDTCKASACLAGPGKPDCDDANPCTDDACDPKEGCTHANNTLACDDGTACTDKDKCADGKCAGAKIDCNDGNACTEDACDPKKGCTNTLQVSNKCRPIIDVTYPPRAATLKLASPLIEVKGTVSSGAGPITSFKLNGKSVKVGKNGAFTVDRVSKVGGNLLVFEATDAMGTPRKRVQSYLWSTDYFKPIESKPKSGMVDPGLGYFLSKAVIDDGVHTMPPNDLATIFELYLQNFKIADLLPQPAYKDDKVTLNITNLKYGKSTVSLVPVTGGLQMTAVIPNVTGDVSGSYKAFSWLPAISLKGTLGITKITITMLVAPKVVNHALVVETKSVNVALSNFTIKLDGLGALLNPIVAIIAKSYQGTLEKSFEDSIAKQIGPVMQNALGALAVSFDLDMDKLDGSGGKVHSKVITDFSAVTFAPDGGVFELRAGVYAKKGNTIDNLGVPARINCGKGGQKLWILKNMPLELAMADDALNELLYSVWLGGLLEFPVPKSMLGDVDLSTLGAKNLVMKTTAMLAPTVDDCNDGSVLEAFIGDFRVDASLEILGAKMDVVLYATFTADTSLKAEKGEVSIALTKVKTLQTEVQVMQDDLVASEAAIEKLIADNLVGGLMSAIGGKALGSFPLPVVDLSGAVPGIPPGTGIAIDPQKVTRKDGNSIIGGKLK